MLYVQGWTYLQNPCKYLIWTKLAFQLSINPEGWLHNWADITCGPSLCRERQDTVLTCASASGYALPPVMIYPRIRITDNLKVGALPSTAFHHPESGWVNAILFMKWFEFFFENDPATQASVTHSWWSCITCHSGCGRAGLKKRHPHALPARSHNTYCNC